MLCRNPFNGFGCGQCTPCRINMRRIWSSRIMLEASKYTDTSFLTLTYKPEKAWKLSDKDYYSLNFLHLRDFWKRFRSRLDREFGDVKIRYYAVGEYGHDGQGFVDASGEQWNPHFHAALFNWSCAGKIQRPEDYPVCHCERCQFIADCWPYGNITLDELNDTTASYIAGYVLKKMSTKDDKRLCGRTPEGSRMSKGIGRDFVDDLARSMSGSFGHLAFQHGDVPFVVNRGVKSLPLGRYLRRKLREALDFYQVDPYTGEVTYGTPSETQEILRQIDRPEVYALRKDIADAPHGEKSSLYTRLDELNDVFDSVRHQRILNMESRFNIYASKGTKKL